MTARWAVLVAALAPTSVAAQWLTYEGGFGVATGSYIFTARTTSWTLATGLSVRAGRITLRATAPLLAQNTTLITSSGAGVMPSGGPSSGMVHDSAAGGGAGGGGMMGGGGMRRVPVPASAVTGYRIVLGDPVLQLAWQPLAAGTALTVSAAAKVPLTDTTEFGTGAWDVGGAVSLTPHIGRTVVGIDLAYWHLGDLPPLDFRDAVLGTVAVGRAVTTRWAASLFAAGATTVLPGYDPPFSVGATVARLQSPSLWALTASVGLTDTAPALAVTVGWRIGLG